MSCTCASRAELSSYVYGGPMASSKKSNFRRGRAGSVADVTGYMFPMLTVSESRVARSVLTAK